MGHQGIVKLLAVLSVAVLAACETTMGLQGPYADAARRIAAENCIVANEAYGTRGTINVEDIHLFSIQDHQNGWKIADTSFRNVRENIYYNPRNNAVACDEEDWRRLQITNPLLYVGMGSWIRKSRQVNIGLMAFSDRNYSLARELLLPVARDDRDVHYALGHMFHFGLGGEKNYDKARKFYCRASVRGYAGAIRSIGDMYLYGDGLERDASRSLWWHKQAALLNSRGAQLILAKRYMKGNLVKKDVKQAYMWMRLSADQNRDEKGEAEAWLLMLRHDMSSDEAAAAIDMWANWKPAVFSGALAAEIQGSEACAN